MWRAYYHDVRFFGVEKDNTKSHIIGGGRGGDNGYYCRIYTIDASSW